MRKIERKTSEIYQVTLGDTGIVLNAPPVGWKPVTPRGFTGEW